MTIKTLIITGTDTDVGKTVVAAGILAITRGQYWKPIQAGTEGETDTQTAQRLSGLPPEHFVQETYILPEPLCPSIAARRAHLDIQVIALPENDSHKTPLIIEGAGGVCVPISDKMMMIDLFAVWGAPVILVARTALGTINHTLLSLEALRARNVPVLGIIFCGKNISQTIEEIQKFCHTPILGHVPIINPLTPQNLRSALHTNCIPLWKILGIHT